MFKNSSELLDCALREFQAAIDSGSLEVKIVLKEFDDAQTYDLREIVNDLEIIDIIQRLGEEFSDYDIKGCFRLDSEDIPGVNEPPGMKYFVVWESVLTKKE